MNTKTTPIPFVLELSQERHEVKHTSVARWRFYIVHLIHKLHDWDATVRYLAPDARTARRWATSKMADPQAWLITSVKRDKS